ncbi:MAG: hypothetical protein N2662_00015 [Bacteroidales bacterium]|nr:hypothetical protein [Bacteroidales bacterium]
MIKRVLAILMLLFMLLAGGGFTIAKHICSSAGTFFEVGMLGTRAHCGMGTMVSGCNNQISLENPDCCTNVIQSLALDIFTVPFPLNVVSFDFVIAQIPTFSEIYPIQTIITSFYTNGRASPFFYASERIAVICVYRK